MRLTFNHNLRVGHIMIHRWRSSSSQWKGFQKTTALRYKGTTCLMVTWDTCCHGHSSLAQSHFVGAVRCNCLSPHAPTHHTRYHAHMGSVTVSQPLPGEVGRGALPAAQSTR